MTRRYVNPVILAETLPDPTKERLVEIYKNEVFKDIDLHTHKHVEGSGVQDLVVRNAVSSDTFEKPDGAVIARLVEYRDARLRDMLQFALAPVNCYMANDRLTLDNEKYIYNFVLPEEFNDNVLPSLTQYIHRYLVFGALFDWYDQFGSLQARSYLSQLEDLEDKINSALRPLNIVKRPMQPFGPADKF